MNTIKLFVYGTLMRGFNNHDYLTGREWTEGATAKWLGEGTTVEPYTLYLIHGVIPAISPGGRHHIIGELWSVPAVRMHNIRYLESGYVETQINVEDTAGVSHVAAAFVMPRKWTEYDDRIRPVDVDSFRKVAQRACFA